MTASPEEAIALLQHLGWPTPYLDLTDDLDVAFFFACHGYDAKAGDPEIIVVDTHALPEKMKLVRHDDVVDPDLNLRWTRQRGFALLAPGWPALDSEDEVNLLRMSGVKAIPFTPKARILEQTAAMREHYYADNSEISAQLAFLVNSIAEACELLPLHPELVSFPH